MERACADYPWRAARAGRLGETHFNRLRPWWAGRGATGSAEIDLVGRYQRRTTLVASCTWRNEWMKIGDLDDPRPTAARAGADAATRVALFSRSGFDPALTARAGAEAILLVTPEQMLEPALVDAGP